MSKFVSSEGWLPVGRQIVFNEAVIKIIDGAQTELTVRMGEGNISWTEHREIIYTNNRKVLADVRTGVEVPVDVRLEAMWEYYTGIVGSETLTPHDAITQTGGGSGWTSSDANTCHPYAVDIEITYTPPAGCGAAETITLYDFRWEEIDPDLRAGMMTFAGKSHVTLPTAAQAA